MFCSTWIHYIRWYAQWKKNGQEFAQSVKFVYISDIWLCFIWESLLHKNYKLEPNFFFDENCFVKCNLIKIEHLSSIQLHNFHTLFDTHIYVMDEIFSKKKFLSKLNVPNENDAFTIGWIRVGVWNFMWTHRRSTSNFNKISPNFTNINKTFKTLKENSSKKN